MKTMVFFAFVLLLAAQVTARGGGRGGGGGRSSSSSRSYSSYSYYGGGGGGGVGLPVWAIVLIVLVIVIAIVILCYSVSENDNQVGTKEDGNEGQPSRFEGSIPCYLCLNKVRNSDWDSGEHRKRCAFKNQRELLGFPQPYNSYCPNCNERLRLWPAKGHPFSCDECPSSRRNVLKRSMGNNRLNCFLCDFDRCVSCSDAERFQRVCPAEAIQPKEETSQIAGEDMNIMIAHMEAERLKDTPYKGGEILTESDSRYTIPYNPNLASTTLMKNEPQSPLPYKPQPFSTIPTTHITVNPSTSNSTFTTPFTIPQQENPPAYTPVQLHVNPYVQSSHPSLPYSISPYPQPNPTEVPNSTEWIPTAPPF